MRSDACDHGRGRSDGGSGLQKLGSFEQTYVVGLLSGWMGQVQQPSFHVSALMPQLVRPRPLEHSPLFSFGAAVSCTPLTHSLARSLAAAAPAMCMAGISEYRVSGREAGGVGGGGARARAGAGTAPARRGEVGAAARPAALGFMNDGGMSAKTIVYHFATRPVRYS